MVLAEDGSYHLGGVRRKRVRAPEQRTGANNPWDPGERERVKQLEREHRELRRPNEILNSA